MHSTTASSLSMGPLSHDYMYASYSVSIKKLRARLPHHDGYEVTTKPSSINFQQRREKRKKKIRLLEVSCTMSLYGMHPVLLCIH